MRISLRPSYLYGFILLLAIGAVIRFIPDFLYAMPFLKTVLAPPWLSNLIKLQQHFDPHLRYFAFNVCWLLFLVIAKKKIMPTITRFCNWFNTDSFYKERVIICSFLILFVVTYQYKIHFGFWHKGVAGWTYGGVNTKIVPASSAEVKDSVPAFLQRGINPGNAKYQKVSGVIPGYAFFLHFANGEIRPANYGLLNMAWASNIFAYPFGPRPALVPHFFGILRNSLSNQESGRRFVLPNAINYNNHMAYMKIDYSSYPPASTLTGVSFWSLKVWVDKNKNATVISGKELNRIIRP